MVKNLKSQINEYITSSWLKEYKYLDGKYKFNKFVQVHFIEEKTARKIATDKNYAMSLSTLEKICTSRDITLEDCFRLVGR